MIHDLKIYKNIICTYLCTSWVNPKGKRASTSVFAQSVVWMETVLVPAFVGGYASSKRMPSVSHELVVFLHASWRIALSERNGFPRSIIIAREKWFPEVNGSRRSITIVREKWFPWFPEVHHPCQREVVSMVPEGSPPLTGGGPP